MITQVQEQGVPKGENPKPLVVRKWSASVAERWDGFVRSQQSRTFFHGTAWKRIIERSFPYKPTYLYVERGDEIRGVLPLFEVSNLISGKALISTPFAVYGGICAADATAHQALRDHVQELARSSGVQYLELRNKQGSEGEGWQRKDLYVNFERELTTNPDEFLKSLPRDTRYMIRKSEKNALQAVYSFEHLDVWYETYAQSLHNLGTPVFPLSYFRNIRDEAKGQVELLTIWHEGRIVAGVMSLLYGDWIHPYYGGATLEARRLSANNYLYFELMRNSGLRGIKKFDFGRSKLGTGAYDFKKEYGVSVHPLPYQYYLVKRKQMPDFSPTSKGFSPAVSAWRKLPFAVTKLLGPRIIRFFP